MTTDRRSRWPTALGIGCVLAWVGVAVAADHREAPMLGVLRPVDIADLYVFASPENPEAVVLILTLNPGAGQTSPAAFRRQAKYNLFLDRDGDSKEDARIRFAFGDPDEDGSQLVKLRSVGLKGLRGQGRTGVDLLIKKDVRLHAGVFDDPFFFDQAGFEGAGGRSLCDAQASDSYARKDVAAIVLEVPWERIGVPRFGVWARTRALGRQVDRMGLAGVNALLIPEPDRPAYNRGHPRNDFLAFAQTIFDALTGVGDDPVDAAAVAAFYLPDVLRFDSAAPPGYPNGRRLDEDVIDFTLPFLGRSPTPTTDCVDANDVAFRSTFPYLAPPHGTPPPCRDADGDGSPIAVPAGCDPQGAALDCDDVDPSVFPGAEEACDAVDSDCDGSLVDEFLNSDTDPAPDCLDIDDDNDGSFDWQDCAPTNPLISPRAMEVCANGTDDDCDGGVDEEPCVPGPPA